MFLSGFTSFGVLILSPRESTSSSLCIGFDAISSDMMKPSQSTHLLMRLPVFADFNVHHNDLLTYSGGANRLSELCYDFPISNDLRS